MAFRTYNKLTKACEVVELACESCSWFLQPKNDGFGATKTFLQKLHLRRLSLLSANSGDRLRSPFSCAVIFQRSWAEVLSTFLKAWDFYRGTTSRIGLRLVFLGSLCMSSLQNPTCVRLTVKVHVGKSALYNICWDDDLLGCPTIFGKWLVLAGSNPVIYTHVTYEMTLFFAGQSTKTVPKLQPKQGSFRFQEVWLDV